ncbi:MAG TPA: type IV pilus modification protein PilV [Steroidobacteraceae bacterium]|jgi:type IV pilus assembly protein PilV|nr:type IV pilus modification protein PilV [Steroidobacteraceae bacterium]
MQRAAGFTLLEVLVSVVILSVALLGTAALTASSLKTTNSSYYLSQSTVLADDILDRMRANIEKARSGDYDIDPDTDCADESTMAGFDCKEWKDGLAAALPGGTGSVEYNAADGTATIVISWDGGADSFTTISQL